MCNEFHFHKMDEITLVLLNSIIEKPGVSAESLADEHGISISTVYKRLQPLAKKCMIKQNGFAFQQHLIADSSDLYAILNEIMNTVNEVGEKLCGIGLAHNEFQHEFNIALETCLSATVWVDIVHTALHKGKYLKSGRSWRWQYPEE